MKTRAHSLLDALVFSSLWAAAAVGALSLWAERRRKSRTVAMEAVGMLALTLATPAAAVTTRSGLNAHAASLWLLAALFFVGSITRVEATEGKACVPPSGS